MPRSSRTCRCSSGARRTPADEHPQRRDEWLAAVAAQLCRHQHLVDDTAAACHRDVVLCEQRGQFGGCELGDEDQRIVGHQRAGQVNHAADVGDRERDRSDLVGMLAEAQVRGETARGGQQGGVAVQHPLGAAGRAGREVDPAGIRATSGSERTRIGVRLVRPQYVDEIGRHRDHGGACRRVARGGVVDDEHVGPADVEGGGHLALTIDVDDRGLGDVGTGQGQHQQRGGHRRGELPGDRHALAYPGVREPAGGGEGEPTDLAHAERRTADVAQQRVIRVVGRGTVQQPGDGARRHRCLSAGPVTL
ncbi:MAG: hypothetical protein JWR37_5301 [Mycobacterium sp.]|nr:hypothetical protein [Mycobacterium sp.]